MQQLKYSTLENQVRWGSHHKQEKLDFDDFSLQEEEIKPRPSYTAQLLGLLLNIQQPVQTRFDKILRKLEMRVMERGEEEEGRQQEDQSCVRCGQCVLPVSLPPAPPPLTGEEQIYPQ